MLSICGESTPSTGATLTPFRNMKAEIKTGITRIFGQHCGCTRLLPVRARFLLRGR